ncbi:flavin reductase family protein [Paraurantiacibacter namhicola]|uniref:4-hydroxyphenylacetate 3-monooxygenase reductase component n=1 Tax=Paraurantiacibacter namhicola TaxID=645517 RepID=A0A1C7D925_9SPHN|nr:flavin reductase family protein [Paraurantiacibacter namhicola]ANU07935.1 4-hydroxyphenylacetate 3-monooxygenase reductase component [Paraurantiacibacter namhicola]
MSDTKQTVDQIRAVFGDAMRHVTATVHAITAGRDGDRHGILATAVSSLSFDPPSLLVCINRSASLHQPLATAEIFAVNVLGLENKELAQLFVDARGEDRFSLGDWQDVAGAPVLQDAQSTFVCRTVDRHEFGTHTIFIGELVHAAHRRNSAPLTYYDREFIDPASADPAS